MSDFAVLHLGRFADIRFGGIPRHVGQLLSSLADELTLVNLVASTDRCSRVRREAGYAIVEAACYGIASGTAIAPALPWLARSIVQRHAIRIVHLHFPDPLSLLAAQMVPKHIPVIATWHSDVVRQRQALRWYQPQVNRLLRRISAVISATQAHFDDSAQLRALPPSKRRIIPYGIHAAAIDNAASREAGRLLRQRHGSRPIVLAVGRHVYYKGFNYLIEAMRGLPDALLVLCGEGELTPALKAQTHALGLAQRVLFAGAITDFELAAWYQACDVFCLPSVERAEAFGLVQLEAMACGKPVVVTRLNNGVNEVHVDGVTGCAVATRDPEGLRVAIERLIADPAMRERMGAAGRERVSSQYSVARMREATLTLYRELIEQP